MTGRNSFFLLEQWTRSNEHITLLDPLLFDEKVKSLHLLNRSGRTHEIIQLLYNSLPVPGQLDSYSYEESIAAMRDLGIFIGILKKHGIEPVEVVPELEYVLLVLMVKTDLPPRDTLLHYTVWNPSGDRMRTYTGLPDERSLVESVKMAMPSLFESIMLLEALHDADLNGPEFEATCIRIRRKMEDMVKGVVYAKKNVSPGVFANELRFYYDPIKVDYNKDYIGPGAVEMPMFVFDHLLWSSDCDDAAYVTFKESLLPYNHRMIREIYSKFRNKASLLTRIEDNLNAKLTRENVRAARAVIDLCTVLKSFRMPHKKMAEDAYQQGESHHKDRGSGGYATDILHHIIQLQNEKIGSLQTSLAYAGMKAD